MNDSTESSPDAPSSQIHGASVSPGPPASTASVTPPIDPETGSVTTTQLPPVVIPEVPPPTPPGEAPAPPARRTRKRLFAVIGAVVAVAVIASIAAVALSGGGEEPSAGRGSPAGPAPLLAPTGFAAAPDAFSVTLTWSQPAGGADVEGYTIYKDGIRVGEVAGGSTTFTDVRVVPGKDYTFEIEAKRGGKVSARAMINAKTPVPALSAARLSGEFNIKLKPTSQYGFQNKYTRTTLGWSFNPKCAEGACNVVWRDLYFKSFRTTLARKGTRYSGSDSGRFDVTCSGARAVTTLAVRFKVTKARAIDGEWRAVRLVGTLTQREVAQLGCVSSGVNWTFTASLFT
jgi:hypothetical protein